MWSILTAVALAQPPQADPALRFLRFADHIPVHSELPERAEGYHSTQALWSSIASLVQENPEILNPEHLGVSVDGRPLWAIHASPSSAQVSAHVVVVAQLHSLEWIGPEVVLELLERWVANPPAGVALTVVPVANPDGRYRVEQDLLSGAPADTYRRANSNLVDLNRDWSVNREPDTWLWPRLPITREFYGVSPAPLSQPETQAIAAMLARIDPTDVVDLHATGGYILVPWAGRYEPTPDHARLMDKATAMAQAMPSRPYRAMQLCHWTRTFRALGAMIDYSYGELGADSFLIEIGHIGLRHLSSDRFHYYNPAQAQREVERVSAAIWGLVHWEQGQARGLNP